MDNPFLDVLDEVICSYTYQVKHQLVFLNNQFTFGDNNGRKIRTTGRLDRTKTSTVASKSPKPINRNGDSAMAGGKESRKRRTMNEWSK